MLCSPADLYWEAGTTNSRTRTAGTYKKLQTLRAGATRLARPDLHSHQWWQYLPAMLSRATSCGKCDERKA